MIVDLRDSVGTVSGVDRICVSVPLVSLFSGSVERLEMTWFGF
jgi:hypothetical protein